MNFHHCSTQPKRIGVNSVTSLRTSRDEPIVATLSGFSTEKGHEQVLLKSIKNMQVQVIRYMNAGDDEMRLWDY